MSELIKMTKDGEVRLVHPVNIKAYQRQGWKIVVLPSPRPTDEPSVVSPGKEPGKSPAGSRRRRKTVG